MFLSSFFYFILRQEIFVPLYLFLLAWHTPTGEYTMYIFFVLLVRLHYLRDLTSHLKPTNTSWDYCMLLRLLNDTVTLYYSTMFCSLLFFTSLLLIFFSSDHRNRLLFDKMFLCGFFVIAFIHEIIFNSSSEWLINLSIWTLIIWQIWIKWLHYWTSHCYYFKLFFQHNLCMYNRFMLT